MFLDFAFPDQEPLHIIFQPLNAAFDFMLHDGLGFADRLDIVVFVLPVDDALWANAFALAVEAEVQNLFFRVLVAGFFA